MGHQTWYPLFLEFMDEEQCAMAAAKSASISVPSGESEKRASTKSAA